MFYIPLCRGSETWMAQNNSVDDVRNSEAVVSTLKQAKRGVF